MAMYIPEPPKLTPEQLAEIARQLEEDAKNSTNPEVQQQLQLVQAEVEKSKAG